MKQKAVGFPDPSFTDIGKAVFAYIHYSSLIRTVKDFHDFVVFPAQK